jgi:hypothetical protein
LPHRPLGIKQAAKGVENISAGNWGTLKPPDPLTRDAKMPACGREGRGGVVAQRLVVMTGTW